MSKRNSKNYLKIEPDHAVKALIHREDKKILLQQRDFNPEITYRGYWTFFGGKVETGEDLKVALERELFEELGCVPGKIGKEIFQWIGETKSINHCFSVFLMEKEDKLILNEGLSMNWFCIEELFSTESLVPGVKYYLPQIRNFLEESAL